MNKVFVFDVDGTLLNSKEEIQECHIEALQEAKNKGHKLVLCSGRSFIDMLHLVKKLPNNTIKYLVCNNGAYIYDLETNDIIMEKDISFSLINKFEEIGRKHNAFFAIHTTKGVNRGWFQDRKHSNYDEIMKHEWDKFNYTEFKELKKMTENKRIAQLSLRTTKEKISILKEEFNSPEFINCKVHVSGEVYVDVNPMNVSKLTGLKQLSKILEIPINSFIAFGDSGNDIQMLEGVGFGVAMGNATKEAKEAADLIIGDNNTDAISQYIMKQI